MKQFLKKRVPIIIFLILYVGWSAFNYTDFGTAIDEQLEYRFGELLYNRTFGRDPQLQRDFAVEHPNSREIWAYNHFHTMLLYIINDSGNTDVYHLLNLLFAGIAFTAAYEIVLKEINKPFLSLSGPMFLMLLPRFFGDIPSNVKDPVFAVYFLIAASMMLINHKLKIIKSITVGIFIGLAASARFIGYSLIPAYFIYRIYEMKKIKGYSAKNYLIIFIECMIASAAAIAVHSIEMPYVAADPVRNLWRLSQIAKTYPWSGQMLYAGTIIQSGNLPWHYLLVWIGVTTPIITLILWAVSHIYIKHKSFFLLHLLFWMNMGLYFLAEPVIYDGMRHYLFLVVTMAVLAALTWGKLWIEGTKVARIFLAAAAFLLVFSISKSYYSLHPYQYTYFNELVGGLAGAHQSFETDYWGLSYKEGAEWLLAHLQNSSPKIIGICGNQNAEVYFTNTNHTVAWQPGCQNIDPNIDYVMAMGRNNEWHFVPGIEIYAVTRDKVPLMKIFKIQ